MAVGAVITKLWVPNPSNIWGQSRTLEDLSRGKAARKRYEKQEREAFAAFVPGSPLSSPGIFPTAAGRAIGRR